MIFLKKDQPIVTTDNGMTRQVLSRGGILMSVEMAFPKGVVGAPHSHPHEQVGYVLYGKFEATVGDQKLIISQGDSYYVPSNVLHSVIALEDSALLDVFTPQRQDFL